MSEATDVSTLYGELENLEVIITKLSELMGFEWAIEVAESPPSKSNIEHDVFTVRKRIVRVSEKLNRVVGAVDSLVGSVGLR